MKTKNEWKVSFWNDNTKEVQRFYYPNFNTAIMVAESFARRIQDKVFVTNGTLDGTFWVADGEIY